MQTYENGVLTKIYQNFNDKLNNYNLRKTDSIDANNGQKTSENK